MNWYSIFLHCGSSLLTEVKIKALLWCLWLFRNMQPDIPLLTILYRPTTDQAKIWLIYICDLWTERERLTWTSINGWKIIKYSKPKVFHIREKVYMVNIHVTFLSSLPIYLVANLSKKKPITQTRDLFLYERMLKSSLPDQERKSQIYSNVWSDFVDLLQPRTF